MISSVHIIHHSHTDFGYTDLPSTTWELHVDFIRQALQCARDTAHLPEAAQFRWVCESLLVVEKFLEEASPQERRDFDQLVQSGKWEVGAMPFNATGLMDQAEWQALHRRLLPLYERYRPTTVFQNDVNGLPWGAIPAWKKAGLRSVWLGLNTYGGAHPAPAPSFWNWEGPTGETILTHLAYHYSSFLFNTHPKEWRRGPVPNSADVWFNQPPAGAIFGTSSAELKAAHEFLQENLRKLPDDYPLSDLAMQATNGYRCDNDPPYAQLSEFIRAWNAAGLQPALRFSTCAEFMQLVEGKVGKELPVRRGDIQDWWDIGVTSTPAETALNQQTKRILAEMEPAEKLLGSDDKNKSTISASLARRAWLQASLYDEHTFGSYDSVARPYGIGAQGQLLEKLITAYRGHELARRGQCELFRSAHDYQPFSESRFLAVSNPGVTTRSGWVTIPAPAIRYPANAARDCGSGELFPLEDLAGVQWAPPEESDHFEVPADVWRSETTERRFYLSQLPAGESRKFELVQTSLPTVPPSELHSQNSFFSWTWEASSGLPSSLKSGGLELLSPEAPFGLGQVVIQSSAAFGARPQLLQLRPENADLLSLRTPSLRSFSKQATAASERFVSEWDDPAFHRIRQEWDFIRSENLIELNTTLWIRETVAPQAFFIAFPFAMKQAKPTYFSWGHPTEVGTDQLPGSCGEFVAVGEGIEFRSPEMTLAVATPETPLGMFEKIHSFEGRRAFTPTNSHFYSVVHNSYWNTNFSITRAGKVSLRHRFSTSLPLPALCGELWAHPSVGMCP